MVLFCFVSRSPFVVADGLTLPFAQLIPWESLVPRLPEADADSLDPDRILRPLRDIVAGNRSGSRSGRSGGAESGAEYSAGGGSQELLRRSATGLAVFAVYFSNPPSRVRGFLACLGAIVERERTRNRRT